MLRNTTDAVAKCAGAILAAAFCSSCIDYSSYQDARIVEPGHTQGTVAVSASQYRPHYEHIDGVLTDPGASWAVINMNPRWGLGHQLDAALRMSVLFTDADLGWLVLGGDIRMGIIKNHFAFTMPVNFALGDTSFETLNIQPGCVVTLPLADACDINGSVRRGIYLNSSRGEYQWWLYNAGLGILVAPGWRLRPEMGWMVSDGLDRRQIYTQFGIGVSHGE